mmetsp:Transcript_38056/g.87925  ORF Transcript_38056/g.87925 Transcript_38056/m.87925 type:complete len:129 (-) Transcript_38056:282-668(-)
MRKGDIKRSIESALRCTYLHVSGQTIAVKVGNSAMDEQNLAENVVAALGDIGDAVPGKWPAIQSLHLKTAESAALPLYNSLPDGAKAHVPEERVEGKPKGGKGAKSPKSPGVNIVHEKPKKRKPKAIV